MMGSKSLRDTVASIWPELQEATRQQAMMLFVNDLLKQVNDEGKISTLVRHVEERKDERKRRRTRAHA